MASRATKAVILEFADVEALFIEGNLPLSGTLKCMGTQSYAACIEDIEENAFRKMACIFNNALSLSKSANEQNANFDVEGQYTEYQVRDIAFHVLCGVCQGNSEKRQRIITRWMPEFPHLPFANSPRWSSPRSSNTGKDTPTLDNLGLSRQKISSSRPRLPSTPNSTMSDDSNLSGTRVSKLNFHRDRARDSATPESPNTVQELDISAGSPPGSTPSAASSRRHNSEPIQAHVGAITVEEGNQQPSTTVPSNTGNQTLRAPKSKPQRQKRTRENTPQFEPGFYEGDSSSSSPSTIRSAVEELLLKRIPPPDGFGTIYALQVLNSAPSMVKIGITYKTLKQRTTQLTRDHGHEFNPANRVFRLSVRSLELERLEKLVHADLAFFQRILRVKHSNGNITNHFEYFQITPALAQKTIDTWIEITRNVGPVPNVELLGNIFRSLHADPDAHVDSAGELDSPDSWEEPNKDHDRKLRVWKKYLVTDYLPDAPPDASPVGPSNNPLESLPDRPPDAPPERHSDTPPRSLPETSPDAPPDAPPEGPPDTSLESLHESLQNALPDASPGGPFDTPLDNLPDSAIAKTNFSHRPNGWFAKFAPVFPLWLFSAVSFFLGYFTQGIILNFCAMLVFVSST